jgi:hypothetical protein
MKNITSHTGIVTDIKRLDSSNYGNPRYQFVVDGYTIKTAVDSSHGYSITNYENKMVDVTIGSHYGTLTLNSIKLTK